MDDELKESEPGDPAEELINEPSQRRLWLLQRALEVSPLEDALELAARAEAFVVGKMADEPCSRPKDSLDGPRSNGGGQPDQDHQTQTTVPPEPVDSLLLPDQKVEVQRRLAIGMTNAEAGAEFNLTPRQVQGFRMQLARRAASAKISPASKTTLAATGNGHMAGTPSETRSPFIEEVVNYLRQQGDVVIRTDQSMFLINNRLPVDFEQLLTRANRMRERHGKSPFLFSRPTGEDAPSSC